MRKENEQNNNHDLLTVEKTILIKQEQLQFSVAE